MVTPRHLRSIVEASLAGPTPPSPSQRLELQHALSVSLRAFQSLLSYPAPKALDRAQVQSKEVRLPNSPPFRLDDMDVLIALKLSDDLHLNEIECVRLLVSANREWSLSGREPLEIFRLAAGLWYIERRDLMTSLYTLFRYVVLDQGLEADLQTTIHNYLQDLIKSGLRQRLITLIKELNRDEPAGYGGPNAERYVLDSRGVSTLRRDAVSQERLSLSHCLVMSVLVSRLDTKEAKDVLLALKDCAADANDSGTIVQLQITFSLLFTLVNTLMSDAIRAIPDRSSALSHQASFRNQFHELVMASGTNPNVEAFVDVVRLAWTVHLMLTQDQSATRGSVSGTLSTDLANIQSCLELVCSSNVFQFLLSRVLQSAAYQNEDEDMVYIYNGYMHKLMMCFVSQPLTRDKVKEMKEKAMSALSPYALAGSDNFRDFAHANPQPPSNMSHHPFVSILELISEIYQQEPELLYGNEELWTFVNFAGEDHTNIQTLVAFLRMLSTLASNEEGASKVFELLQGKIFRSIGWSTLFDCLSIYDEKFKQSLQISGTLMPDFQEGDAQAVVAYLTVLQKVVENGNPTDRKKWFPDIEPLFKLLSYENVPPFLKGALRNTISAFIHVSPVFKDTIWSYLQQYDLPVVVDSMTGNKGHNISSQVYDMRFELNEVEARSERYPSTISFLNLLNALIAEEKDVSDRGGRFWGIFRFVYDHVFGSFSHRAYADHSEKWKLAVPCLQHFQIVLSMYDIKDSDADNLVDLSQPPTASNDSPLEMQLPVLELMKDFMGGKVVFRNIMSIIASGVNALIRDRSSQIHGPLVEKAVHLSLEILFLVMQKDLFLADLWRPLYQPLDVILCQDHNQIIALLEYVQYYYLPQIQQYSIKIMNILSSRVVGLVQLLLKSSAAKSLVEEFAICLDSRFEESEVIENTKDDPGLLILQLLIDNIGRPAPNITHLLLKFDVDGPVERTVLQPKFHYSCLKVILDNLETLSKPDVNALLHEFSFELLYELCLDPLTGGPMIDLLSSKKYQFFSKHVESLCVSPLPKRSNNLDLRISTLHQRGWLLKLLALELHLADMSASLHRETCRAILSQIFIQCTIEDGSRSNVLATLESDARHGNSRTMNKSKVLDLLEVVQFRSPDISLNYPRSNSKLDTQVEGILRNPATSQMGGVYYYTERDDRLIDHDAFASKLGQVTSHLTEAEKGDLREFIKQLLRWVWRYNKNLEEQAAQLHMLTGWSHIVEVAISRRLSFLEDHSQILFELLDASLSASASPDCSLKMAVILSQVALTCLAKLRDERFLCPGGLDTDSVTCLDIISVKQLSTGACHSILFKLIMAILRNESSETLRRRQFALLLSYFQYCQSMLDPDVPSSILHFLLHEEQDEDDDMNLQKIDREQAELSRANFSILRKEAQALIDVVTKDAFQGSEAGKSMAIYVMDALINIDQDNFFLNQFQSRGILRSCITDIGSFTPKDGWYSVESLQRLYTLEAQLSLLLRISHNYGKHGAQILLSMGILEHLASCKALSLQIKGSSRRRNVGTDQVGEIDLQRFLVTPILRLVATLTSLADLSAFLEVRNKIVDAVVDFIKAHQSVFDQIIREDISGTDEFILERVNLVVSILSKVWPYEENDNYGFVQQLFIMTRLLFNRDNSSSSKFTQPLDSLEKQKKSELLIFRLCFNLCSYLYFLIRKKGMRLQILDASGGLGQPLGQQQPTLLSLVQLLNSATVSLEKACEEKCLLLSKIQDINELPRQEVDEIVNLCMRQECLSPQDHIRKRRYIAMVEMCRMAGFRDQLITLLLQLAERVFDILLIHFQDGDRKPDIGDFSLLYGRLHPTLERLQQLSEEKIGHDLKLFHRSVSALKEVSMRHLAA